MANIKQIKSEALATIDAALSILNRFPDLNESNTELSFNTSTNPFTFLMDLFNTTTGYNKLISIWKDEADDIFDKLVIAYIKEDGTQELVKLKEKN